jgi:hypothetical protein
MEVDGELAHRQDYPCGSNPRCPLRRRFDVPSGRLGEEGMEPRFPGRPAFSRDTSPKRLWHPFNDDYCETKERFKGDVICIADKKQLNVNDMKIIVIIIIIIIIIITIANLITQSHNILFFSLLASFFPSVLLLFVLFLMFPLLLSKFNYFFSVSGLTY